MPYFDYNATTPPLPDALAIAQETAAQAWHNPSSPYRAAARAHALLEEAREQLAGLVGGDAKNYIFTSGATEANNAVFAHFARQAPATARVVVSAIEHPSVLEAAQAWFPGRVTLLRADTNGVTRLDKLEETLRAGKIALVSLMAANNETGALQPWREAAELCRERGVPFDCDATQWFGKLPPQNLAKCDFLTGSAHKFGGVKGAGFLKVPPGADFHGQRGGEQEQGRRAGTENLPAIRAMVAALAALTPRLEKTAAGWESARQNFEAALAHGVPGAVIVGAKAARLGNTVMLIAPRHENMRWVAALDKRGCQISTGSACATGREGPSHVLAAMGISAESARRALRISAGWDTTAADWEALVAAFADARESLDKDNPTPDR
jgi:cysteine desulfurase